MIYIALTFLVGILCLYNKALAIAIFLLVIISIFRKKVHWLIIIITLITPIFSFKFFEQQLLQESHKQRSILEQPNINQYASFQSVKQLNRGNINGIIKINSDSYRFYYYSNEPLNISQINNKSCYVQGSFKSISPNIHRSLIVTLKHINIENCKIQHNSVNAKFSQHKQQLYYKIQHSGLQQYDKVIALLFGDVSLLPKQLVENVKDIGIYHLMAVSGSHIVAIVAMVYFFCIRLSIPIPFIKVLICILLPIYAYYTDFAPSALRAIITVLTVILIPRTLLYRAIDILGSTFIIIAVTKPQYIYDIGFQFSFIILL